VRYLADASFWLYLAHLPLVIVGQAVMRRLELPMPVELLLLLAAVIAILLASYHWIVRPTWIGALLNGSRKGRGSPGE
jgi:peptidoglycan/LPS O-acetylase OafA/YrhL